MLADIEEIRYGEAQHVDLFYHKDNVVAKELYASLGFVETGIIQDNSVHAIRKLDSKLTATIVE